VSWSFEDVKKEVSRWAIVAVVGWAGWQIEKMTEAVNDLTTAVAVLKVERTQIVDRLDRQADAIITERERNNQQDVDISRLNGKVFK